jgi:hypothetical protein
MSTGARTRVDGREVRIDQVRDDIEGEVRSIVSPFEVGQWVLQSGLCTGGFDKALVRDFLIIFLARVLLADFDLSFVRIGMELSCERRIALEFGCPRA